jgi:hypothetical protein
MFLADNGRDYSSPNIKRTLVALSLERIPSAFEDRKVGFLVGCLRVDRRRSAIVLPRVINLDGVRIRHRATMYRHAY